MVQEERKPLCGRWAARGKQAFGRQADVIGRRADNVGKSERILACSQCELACRLGRLACPRLTCDQRKSRLSVGTRSGLAAFGVALVR
jgi:hypothetical protein